MKFKVNMKLLPIKAHYFLTFAATAPILPFLPIYAKQLGFDAVGVGIIYAVLPFAAMVAKPLAGWIADAYRIQKRVFLVTILLASIFLFSLQAITQITPDNSAVFHCTNPVSVLKVCRTEDKMNQIKSVLPSLTCPVNCKLTCTMKDETSMRNICSAFNESLHGCSSDPLSPLYATSVTFNVISNISVHDSQFDKKCLLLQIDNATHRLDDEDKTMLSIDKPTCPVNGTSDIACQADCQNEEIQQFVRKGSIFASSKFWIFFVLITVGYSSYAVTTSMGDAICFELLEGKHENFGQQRVWGSIGWGIFTVIAGYLVDRNSEGNFKDYTPAFLLMAGLTVVDLLCSMKMRITSNVKPPSLVGDICRLLCRPRVLVFNLWCVTAGILTSAIWNWLPWYLTDLATPPCGNAPFHWITLLIGLDMAIQCFVGEVPMFFVSGFILHKLGHVHTMTLVLAAFGLRLLLYSVISSPWLALPIEILNGITFGIFYATMTSYAYVIAPAGFGSTMQGIVGAAFEGLGLAIGSLVGGAIYKNYGGPFLFQAFGVFSLVMCLLHALLQLLMGRFCHEDNDAGQKGFQVVATFEQGGSDQPVSIQAIEERPIVRENTKDTVLG